MTQEELINAFKYIVKKCDMLINNGNYEADDYTQDTVEDIAELCNHILDGDYGKLVEAKEVQEELNITGISSKHATGKLKECIDNAKKAKLNAMLDESLSKETKESWNERLDKKDFRERYRRIAESEAFKKAHEGVSIGDVIPIEGEEPISKVWHDYLSNEDDTLMKGEKLLVVYENSAACPPEIITYNTDVWTDEIVRWARLEDILKL